MAVYMQMQNKKQKHKKIKHAINITMTTHFLQSNMGRIQHIYVPSINDKLTTLYDSQRFMNGRLTSYAASMETLTIYIPRKRKKKIVPKFLNLFTN